MFSPSSGFFRKSVAISGNKRSFKVMSGSSVSPFRYAIDTLKYSAIFNRVVLRGKEFSVHLLYALFDKPIASHTAAGEILRSLHNCSNLVLNILCSSVKASYTKYENYEIDY